nr:MAG: hypothetical protein AM324_10975 [Candidatus Thorarchaeota archaeon SMTZ1-83]
MLRIRTDTILSAFCNNDAKLLLRCRPDMNARRWHSKNGMTSSGIEEAHDIGLGTDYNGDRNAHRG